MNNNNMTETYDTLLARLEAKEITHREFLKEANCEEQFTKWCEEHQLEPDDNAAEFFFDQHGFEDSSIVKEFIEPIQ